MARDTLPEVTSSRSRLKIADLVSGRPCSLRELARSTGISMQGVLKHLKKLESLGLAEERTVRGPDLAVRKVYVARGVRLRDFSTGDMTLVKLSEEPLMDTTDKGRSLNLEGLAEETILQRRRVKEHARRLGRMIDDLVENESRVRSTLEQTKNLTDTERLVLQVLFSEETMEDGERVLLDEFGLKGGADSMARVLSKVRHPVRNSRTRA